MLLYFAVVKIYYWQHVVGAYVSVVDVENREKLPNWWNNANVWAVMPFKVTDRKLIYDFLLVVQA